MPQPPPALSVTEIKDSYIKYACYISFEPKKDKSVRGAVRVFSEALNEKLFSKVKKPVFFDESRLEEQWSDDAFDEKKLSKIMCESACMVLIYWSNRFDEDHSYALQEYLSMKKLERERLALLENKAGGRRSLIIPVIIRGENRVLPEIRENPNKIDFSRYNSWPPVMKNNDDFPTKIDQIAGYIADCCNAFDKVMGSIPPVELCDCGAFTLSSQGELHQWLQQQHEEQSFAAPRGAPSPFPLVDQEAQQEVQPFLFRISPFPNRV